MSDEPKVKRVPVSFLWSKLNWDYLKMLAEIAQYAEGKYGSAEQYTNARLENQASPVNHIYEHLRQYQAGEEHDRFGDPRYHLAAIGYNAMMEFFYHTAWGQKLNIIMQRQREVGGSLVGKPLPVRTQPGEVEAALIRRTLAEAPAPPSADWAEGLSHFRLRWQSGYEGARDPGARRRWKAMLDVIEQFAEANLGSDEVVRGIVADITRVAFERMDSLKSPENIEECQAMIAACETISKRIPEMFPKKGGG